MVLVKQKRDLLISFKNRKKYKVQVVEGIDSGGEDGIYIFTKSQTMKEIMSDSKTSQGIINYRWDNASCKQEKVENLLWDLMKL